VWDILRPHIHQWMLWNLHMSSHEGGTAAAIAQALDAATQKGSRFPLQPLTNTKPMRTSSCHVLIKEALRLTPRMRQTLLFSATMTNEVKDLAALSLQRFVRLAADTTKAAETELLS